MPNGRNAEHRQAESRITLALNSNDRIAVEAFNDIVTRENLDKYTAWKAIAKLLLTCEVWEGKRTGWSPLVYERCIVFEEANTFGVTKSGEEIAKYSSEGSSVHTWPVSLAFRPKVSAMRSAFIGGFPRSGTCSLTTCSGIRSGLSASLTSSGSVIRKSPTMKRLVRMPNLRAINAGASPGAKIDIVARRGDLPVALMSCKWRYRHDRVEFVEEFMRYLTPARRLNSNMEFYAITGEFSSARLHKALEASQPASVHGPMSGGRAFRAANSP